MSTISNENSADVSTEVRIEILADILGVSAEEISNLTNMMQLDAFVAELGLSLEDLAATDSFFDGSFSDANSSPTSDFETSADGRNIFGGQDGGLTKGTSALGSKSLSNGQEHLFQDSGSSDEGAGHKGDIFDEKNSNTNDGSEAEVVDVMEPTHPTRGNATTIVRVDLGDGTVQWHHFNEKGELVDITEGENPDKADDNETDESKKTEPDNENNSTPDPTEEGHGEVDPDFDFGNPTDDGTTQPGADSSDEPTTTATIAAKGIDHLIQPQDEYDGGSLDPSLLELSFDPLINPGFVDDFSFG